MKYTKIITLVFILALPGIAGFSQNEKKAAKAALKCIDKKLASAGKDVNYLLLSAIEYQDMVSGNDIEKFESRKKEVDSVLAVCGFYEADHLNVKLLMDCMRSTYNLNDERNDTASAYYQLLDYLIYLSENPSILRETSPALHLGAVKSILTPADQNNDFYKAMSFILFQGITKEMENYARDIHNDNQYSLMDAKVENEDAVQTISIVDDDVEIEQELTLDIPVKTPVPCDEKIFMVVDKMPAYRGGEEALKRYLHVHSSETQGKVYVRFVIDCHGNVTRPEILEGLTPLADKVALDLVKSMPKWIPGESDGKKVSVQKEYPVVFD